MLQFMTSCKRFFRKTKLVFLVSKNLGSGVQSTSRLFFWGLFKALYDSKGIYPRNPIIIRFNYNLIPFHFRRYSDFGLAFEILIANSYKLTDQKSSYIQCILDLGANSGVSALYFRSLYPESKIICFEPDPNSFKQLSENADLLGNVSTHQLVVSNQIGELDFHIDPQSSVTSSLIKRNNRQIPIKIKTKCLKSIVDQLHDQINILKIDIEGSEEIVIEHFDDFRKIDKLIGEIHFDLCDGNRVLEKIKSHFIHTEIYPISDNRCYVIASHN